MIETPGTVIVDCRVIREENCYPMIPAGAAHNHVLLGDEKGKRRGSTDSGLSLV